MRIRGYAPATPCWAELTSVEPVAAASFYEQLFDWKVDGGRFLVGDDAVAGLSADRTGAGWVTHLSTDDLGESLARVLTAGGRHTAPADHPDHRSSVVTDPAGAVFGLWQRGTEPNHPLSSPLGGGFPGAQVVGEPGAVCWAELRTGDPLGAADFYSRSFDWVLRGGPAADSERGEWLTAARDSVAVLAPAPGGRAHWLTTFQVEDCDAVVAASRRLGGRASEPLDTDAGRYAELTDPFGATFGVIEPIRSAQRGR